MLENKSKIQDDKEYLKDINIIIERMSNYHFKWYISSLTIIAFIIALYSFVFNGSFMNYKSLLTLSVFAGVISVFLYSVSLYNSLRYLTIERCFRVIKNKILNGDLKEQTYEWKEFKKDLITDKKSFVKITHIMFFIIVLSIAIIIPLVYFIN